MSRRVVSYDLFGWKAIGAAAGVSGTTARRYAALHEDPLPVSKLYGRVRARTEDVHAWVRRHEVWNTVGADAA